LNPSETSVIGRLIGKEGKNLKVLEAKAGPSVKIRVQREKDQLTIHSESAVERDRALELLNDTLGKLVFIDRIHHQSKRKLQTATKDTSAQASRLYVDVLNYAKEKFFRSWSIQGAQREVERFVQAATRSNFDMVVFIDQGFSEEAESDAFAKWTERRLAEVTDGEKTLPQGMSVMLGEMFRELGVEVRYSLDEDNDHTLAGWAFHDSNNSASVIVVSRDSDFLRYNHPNTDEPYVFPLCADFEVNEDGPALKLFPREIPPSIYAAQKPRLGIISPPPQYHQVRPKEPLFTVRRDQVYRRGVPSPLIKTLGYNPYIVIRPLRQVLYHELFANGSGRTDVESASEMIESFPMWNNVTNQAEFVTTNVPIPPKRDEELFNLATKDPKRTFERFFSDLLMETMKPRDVSDEDWKNHRFACIGVVVEICCSFPGNNIFYLETMMRAQLEEW